MFGRLLLLLILLPAIEIVLLVWVAGQTSIWFVLGLLVGAGLLGAWLARQQGLRVMARIAGEVRAGRMPADAVIDAVLISLAAVLLILPGFLSDLAALGLLFPPTRQWFKALLRRRIQARIVTARYQSFGGGRDEIIDVRVVDSPPRHIG